MVPGRFSHPGECAFFNFHTSRDGIPPEGVGEWEPEIEKDTEHIGSLGPGDSVYARFVVNVKPDVAMQFTEWRLGVESRIGTQVQRTNWRLILRPESRESIDNPYTTGRAVRGEHFVGRTREVDSVVSAVAGKGPPNPVLVYGIRRIGKTSILLRMQDQPEVSGQYCIVYFSSEDRPDTDTSSEFLLAICDKIRRQLPQGLEKAIPYQRREFELDPFHAFEAFMTGWYQVAPKKRLLLLLDEIDRLFALIDGSRRKALDADRPLRPNEAFLPEVLGALRKAIMEHDGFNVIFAGLPGAFKRLHYQERFHGLMKLVEVQGRTSSSSSVRRLRKSMTCADMGDVEVHGRDLRTSWRVNNDHCCS